MKFTTADLCDEFPQSVRVADAIFLDYGGVPKFAGRVETLRVFEDNSLLSDTLSTPGRGRVLVVDGGGSLRTALIGGRLAGLAHSSGWAGLVVNGAIRDSAEIRGVPIGVRALGLSPLRSQKGGKGDRGSKVSFAGVMFSPEDFLYADEDGIIVADRALRS